MRLFPRLDLTDAEVFEGERQGLLGEGALCPWKNQDGGNLKSRLGVLRKGQALPWRPARPPRPLGKSRCSRFGASRGEIGAG